MILPFKDAPAGVTVLVTPTPTHVELVRLVVHEDLRGRGLGELAVRRLQKLNRPIRLTAVPETGKKTALHRFYRRIGFKATATNSIGENVFQ
jgi:GNAT superfamily N-acetyltransferase